MFEKLLKEDGSRGTPEDHQNQTIINVDPQNPAIISADPLNQAIINADPQNQTIINADPQNQTIIIGNSQNQIITNGDPQNQIIINGDSQNRTIIIDHSENQTIIIGDPPNQTIISNNPQNRCIINGHLYVNLESSSHSVTDETVPKSPENKSLEPVFTCPICMAPLVEEVSTKCGHIFCKECIKTAVAANGKCPTCRKKVTRNSLIRVFLPSTN
ncbi:hypothetical protein VNO78_09849 [Psophocarpus tetragonolobus]|uniref:RING-type domain-containing protein n=1 Tax=Psophocarpus tetragonolobus TaxID=3891 RepID=A0AAN9SZS8_PSOTE